MTKFNPKKHLTQIRGQDYLEVKWRLVWFREEHLDWGIRTKIVEWNKEKGKEWVVFKAKILNGEGVIMAEATKGEAKATFADYLEKAETGAIGRALAMCGYGTQFAPDFNEGERIVDSPINKRKE